jgi:Flp pilus assembly protein TadG
LFLARCRRGNVTIIFALLLLPLVGLAGMVVDYGRALSLNARLQSASDAAALAVSEAYSADPTQSEPSLQAVAQNYVNAAMPSDGAQVSDFHVCTTSINDCTDNGNALQNKTVALSVSANPSRTLSKVLVSAGGSTSVAAHSVATINVPQTIAISLVFDSSASMIVGATAADVTTISNWVSNHWSSVKPGDPPPSYPGGDNPPCAFACHDVGGSTQPSDIALGLSRAQSAGATTRWDVMVQAAQQLISHVQTEKQTTVQFQNNTYLFNVLSFDSTLHTWGTSNMGFSSATSAIASMSPGLDTHLSTAMTSLITQVGNEGTGQSAASPLKFVILITDGLQSDRNNNWSCSYWSQDSYWNYNTCYGGYATTIDTTQCAQIKSNGAVLAVLETPYVPLTGQSPAVAPYEKTVRHVIYPDGPNTSSVVSQALQSCATSGYYFQATSSSQIATGFIALTDKFLFSVPYLTH